VDRKKFIRAKSELKTYLDLIKPHPMAAQRIESSVNNITLQLNQHKLGSLSKNGAAKMIDLSTAGMFSTKSR